MIQTLQLYVLLLCLVSQPYQAVCSQTYAEPYYDPTMKLVFRNKPVLAEFISVFTENRYVTVLEFMDGYMNPLQAAGQAREFVNDGRFKTLMGRVGRLERDQIKVQLRNLIRKRGAATILDEDAEAPAPNSTIEKEGDWKLCSVGADFLYNCSRVFSDLRTYFPAPERNSQLDVICRISDKTIAMVEVQVIPENYWDARALYYASGVYFNQLRRGGQYEHLTKVISIQLLGTGNPISSPWKKTPKEYIRRYKFLDKVRGHALDQIELVQICVPHLKKDRNDLDAPRALLWKEWTEFLKRAHLKDAKYVKTLSSSNLKTAYACLNLKTMSRDVLERYTDERNRFTRFSEFISLQIEAEKEKIQENIEAEKERFRENIEAEKVKFQEAEKAKYREKIHTKTLEFAAYLLSTTSVEPNSIAISLGLKLANVMELKESMRIAGSDHFRAGSIFWFLIFFIACAIR